MKSITRRNFIRFASLFGAAALAGSITGCSQNSKNITGSAQGSSQQSGEKGAASNADSSASTVLVAYFSAQGHTKRAAETIADELGADIFEIVCQDPYTDDDLDYNDDDSRVSQEHDDKGKRDVLLAQTTPEGFSDYETVLVGYPIWWGEAAWPINHFAIDNDFEGKKVRIFCTSASSGLGQSTSALAELAGSGDWKDGQRFSSSASEDEIRSWAKNLL